MFLGSPAAWFLVLQCTWLSLTEQTYSQLWTQAQRVFFATHRTKINSPEGNLWSITWSLPDAEGMSGIPHSRLKERQKWRDSKFLKIILIFKMQTLSRAKFHLESTYPLVFSGRIVFQSKYCFLPVTDLTQVENIRLGTVLTISMLRLEVTFLRSVENDKMKNGGKFRSVEANSSGPEANVSITRLV